ncbi:MAG: winged helix-turn-helix transcriptional regulator [Proteobacteria bacterium]|nr:winged helix-turn-helix transcriptional regulator [Pseudomonadota bacterium]
MKRQVLNSARRAQRLETSSRWRSPRTDDLEARASDATRLLKLLANEQRLKVLCRLSAGEASVSDLADYVDIAQSALSQHLAKLRADRLVDTRRDGQTIYYRLSDPMTQRLVGVLCDMYGAHN